MSGNFKKTDPFDSSNKLKQDVVEETKTKNKVRVKFNYDLLNPDYDFGLAMRKAKDEKNHLAYTFQRNIDISLEDSRFAHGRIYEVSEEFYNKWSKKFVETFNSLFGAYQGKALDLIKRPKYPFVFKVNEDGFAADPMEQKYDLWPKSV